VIVTLDESRFIRSVEAFYMWLSVLRQFVWLTRWCTAAARRAVLRSDDRSFRVKTNFLFFLKYPKYGVEWIRFHGCKIGEK